MSSSETHVAIGGESNVNELLTAHLRAPAGFAPGMSRDADALWVSELSRGPRPATGEGHISKLLERLNEEPSFDRPEFVTVSGVFYPAVLLTPGIWDRPGPGEGAQAPKWRTPLQDWLFSGFEQWAPSWDLNASGGDDQPFFGQLGHEDEAFSLLVIVTGPQAGRLREKLLAADEMVCNAELTGALIHRKHARAKLPPRMEEWGKSFDYCLRVDLSQDHRIERSGVADPYSGYLWECVAPKQWVQDKDVPELTDSFFVWEHTDFASPESRAYGLDTLEHKHAYIEERFGELELVQKSAPIVPGEPVLGTESFYAVVERGPG
ncbi:MAG TPA: hypothetical protein VFT86_05660 [Gaiellaceae bacterium]|nr:hypothetical protein [Gaiellaceae bacterium]